MLLLLTCDWIIKAYWLHAWLIPWHLRSSVVFHYATEQHVRWHFLQCTFKCLWYLLWSAQCTASIHHWIHHWAGKGYKHLLSCICDTVWCQLYFIDGIMSNLNTSMCLLKMATIPNGNDPFKKVLLVLRGEKYPWFTHIQLGIHWILRPKINSSDLSPGFKFECCFFGWLYLIMSSSACWDSPLVLHNLSKLCLVHFLTEGN